MYKDKLESDFLLIIDGPSHPSNIPTLTFGARGISRVTLTSYGPIKPQHSGHFGNYAPNPAMNLSKILSSMKDYDGKVTIPDFYDGIILDEKNYYHTIIYWYLNKHFIFERCPWVYFVKKK